MNVLLLHVLEFPFYQFKNVQHAGNYFWLIQTSCFNHGTHAGQLCLILKYIASGKLLTYIIIYIPYNDCF